VVDCETVGAFVLLKSCKLLSGLSFSSCELPGDSFRPCCKLVGEWSIFSCDHPGLPM